MQIKAGKYNISISIEVQNILSLYIQNDPKAPENGGIILGKIANASDIQLLKLSIPTELDKASRTNFERHRLSAQIIINYEHINSHGQMLYLGEWHTHPEDHPKPSEVDVIMIKQQFERNKIHTDFLLLLIQGRKTLYVGCFDKNGLRKIDIE
jgi:integrative and conjugative element protein (TIGR02256 family)